jgi:hypothetical protein
LLIEEQRTNSIRNNTMVGAVAGMPGTLPTNWTQSVIGLTRTVVGTGTENGITYVDIRIAGTTTSQFGFFMFEPVNQIAATSGQSWTESFYAKIVAGSMSGIGLVGIRLAYNDAGGAFISGTFPAITLTASLARFSGTGVAPANTAFIQPGIYFNGVNPSGVAVDITFRIGLPQLERGAFATSVIPTTTTALTRAADVASVNTLSPWFNATTGAVFGEWNSFANSTVRYVVDIEQAASSNDRIDIPINTSNVVNPRTVVGGAAIASLAGGTYTVNTNAKVAFAYASADYASSLNGAAAVTATTAGALPSSLARMFIGSLAGATQINGYLRRITYFNRRLANSELQLLSS